MGVNHEQQRRVLSVFFEITQGFTGEPTIPQSSLYSHPQCSWFALIVFPYFFVISDFIPIFAAELIQL
jgi:hypothetical protein